jgi:hypothetical protein
MGAIGYDWFFSVLNSGVWISAQLLLSFPFSFYLSYLPSGTVSCPISFNPNLFSLTLFFFFFSFLSFFLHVRVTIFDVSWCHVRQSRKITIATIECKMLLITKVTAYECRFLARA